MGVPTANFPSPSQRPPHPHNSQSPRLSQTETSLCIIEGLSTAFSAVLAAKRDRFLLRNQFTQQYGDVVITVKDYSPPAFRMMYSMVVDMLRGVALFMGLYGWFEFEVGIFNGGAGGGHVGVGSVSLESGVS